MALTQSLNELAEESGIDIDILQELNSNLIQIKNEPQEIKVEAVESNLFESGWEDEKPAEIQVVKDKVVSDWGDEWPSETPTVKIKDDVIEHVKEHVEEDHNKKQVIDVKERPKRQLKQNRVRNDYNLRGRNNKITKVHNKTIWTNRRLDANCIRDKALTKVDLDEYHEGLGQKDEFKTKLLTISKQTQRSQLGRFTYNSRKFIIVTWLSVVRIFEYNHDKTFYFEIKRLPQRYFDLHSNLITSVHYNNEKVYIAYLTSRDKGGYVEIRDLKSNLLGSPYHYDDIVESIQSDELFIYIKTIDNYIHMHRRSNFHLVRYCVDLNWITNDYALSARAEITKNNPYTKIDVFVATTKQCLLLNWTAISSKSSVAQNYNLDCRYETISAHHIKDLIVLHRNLNATLDNYKHKSKLEILRKISPERHSKQYHIVQERTINYDYSIAQVELSSDEDRIFLLGQDAAGKCEICCLNTTDFTPIWSYRLIDVAIEHAKIIVQDDHVVILQQQNQRLMCVRIEVNRFNDCQMHQGAETQINVNMK